MAWSLPPERRLRGMLAATLCGAALVGVYVLAVRTAAGQAVDVGAMARLQVGGRPTAFAASWVRAALPAALALLCLALGVLALRHGRARDVVGALVVAVGPVLASRWLRTEALGRPDLGEFGYDYNTLPSGHVSAAVGLAAAAVLLWPRATRDRATRVAVVVALAACLASVVGHAHRPSDVVASVLLVGAVGGAVVALLDVPSAGRASVVRPGRERARR